MRGHIADRTVKTREVVVLDERFNRSVRIVLAQQYARSNAILFDRLMEALDLAIALWVVMISTFCWPLMDRRFLRVMDIS